MSAPSSRSGSPRAPSRPVLYGRTPNALGTPLVESLTGFLSRLSAARSLLLTDVLDRLVRPLLPPGTLRPRRDLSWFLTRHVSSFDGAGDAASTVVRALERLTGRDDLVLHTFLPWRSLFSPHGPGAIRQGGKRWCCRCLEAMHADGVEPWEPLLWRLAPATWCPEHRIPLSERCPSCGRTLHVVTQRVPSGYCERCGHLLHRDDPHLDAGDFDPERDTDALSEWWTSVALAQMLAAQSLAAQHAASDRFVDFLRDALDRHGSNVESLVRTLGLNRSMVERWLDRSRRPRLRPFLTACIRLRARPVEVGTGVPHLARDAVHCPWLYAPSVRPDSGTAASDPSRQRAWDARWAWAVPALDRFIAGGGCPSVAAVERSLGLSRGTVHRRDPDRYAALRACCAVRREAERGPLRDRAKQALDSAIAGPRFRSAYEVARSLGVYSGTLERWFPERYEQLVALHASRRQQASRAVLDRRCGALRVAVFDLVRSGQHPSLPTALAHAGLPPTLCRIPSVRPAFEAALAACGLPPLPQGIGSAPLDRGLDESDADGRQDGFRGLE